MFTRMGERRSEEERTGIENNRKRMIQQEKEEFLQRVNSVYLQK